MNRKFKVATVGRYLPYRTYRIENIGPDMLRAKMASSRSVYNEYRYLPFGPMTMIES